MPAIVKVDSVLLSKDTMTDHDTDIKSTDPQDLLRLLRDLLALELTPEHQERLKLFMSGKGSITLNNRKYTKEDLKDLFYSQN